MNASAKLLLLVLMGSTTFVSSGCIGPTGSALNDSDELFISLSLPVSHSTVALPLNIEVLNGEFDEIHISTFLVENIKISQSLSGNIEVSAFAMAGTEEGARSLLEKSQLRSEAKTASLSLTSGTVCVHDPYKSEAKTVASIQGECLLDTQIAIPADSKTKIFLNDRLVLNSLGRDGQFKWKDLMRWIRAERHGDDKMIAIKTYGQTQRADQPSPSQLSELLASLKFEDEREQAIRLLRRHL